MSKLYPLKFTPILKDKIWGGEKLKTVLNKDFAPLPNAGESWEISCVPGNISSISNGFLAGNNLEELIEIYMGDLVGDKIYEKYGKEFPLLIKFIDANDVLSIQVHPDDKLAKERHDSFGKTEMWYVVEADEKASLISGFGQKVDKKTYLEKLEANKLEDILSNHEVQAGDVFFIPAGRVHAIGKGILLAEIQQTSDVTYRIYDFDRKDNEGNTRELHTEQAIDAIDYKVYDNYKTDYQVETNKPTNLAKCDYFTTNVLEIESEVKRDYELLDSFVIFMGIEGSFRIQYGEDKFETVSMGETVLLPADLKDVSFIPEGKAKFLEVYID